MDVPDLPKAQSTTAMTAWWITSQVNSWDRIKRSIDVGSSVLTGYRFAHAPGGVSSPRCGGTLLAGPSAFRGMQDARDWRCKIGCRRFEFRDVLESLIYSVCAGRVLTFRRNAFD